MRFLHLPFLAFFNLTVMAQNTPPPELKLELGAGITMEMVLISPGSFEQGSPAAEQGREMDEAQRHVTLSKAYYLGKYPVTRGQFARFIESARYKTESEQGQSGGFGIEGGKLVQRKQYTWRDPGFAQTDDHPVVIITAQDAKTFCQWLTNHSNRICTLPSEAQWEYACRAGTTTAHYAESIDDLAWHRGNSLGSTHPVGEKRANGWGLHDLYGPVWQWCSDWYAPYSAGSITDPMQKNADLSDKPRQVLRGGSFISDSNHARSAERYRNDVRSRNADNGFRILYAIDTRPSPAASAAHSSVPSPTTRPSHELPSSYPPPIKMHDSTNAKPSGFNPFGLLLIPVFIFIAFKIFFSGFSGFGGRGNMGDTSRLTPRQAADAFTARPAPIAQRFAFQMSDSGFYINGPAEAMGSMIYYTADLGDRVITDEISFTPGPEGQFIFTGVRPKSVSVRTTGGQLGTTSGMISSSNDDDDRRSNYSSSSSRSSYPSAY